jgi:hypothetical protein
MKPAWSDFAGNPEPPVNPVPLTQKLTAVCISPWRQKTTGVGTRQS